MGFWWLLSVIIIISGLSVSSLEFLAQKENSGNTPPHHYLGPSIPSQTSFMVLYRTFKVFSYTRGRKTERHIHSIFPEVEVYHTIWTCRLIKTQWSGEKHYCVQLFLSSLSARQRDLQCIHLTKSMGFGFQLPGFVLCDTSPTRWISLA